MIDEHSPHRFGRRREKVPAAIEVLVPDEPQIGFVDQGGGVEGVTGILGGHPRCRELPQLVVNEREQVGRCLAISAGGGFQQVSDLGHDDRVYRRHHCLKTEARQRPAEDLQQFEQRVGRRWQVGSMQRSSVGRSLAASCLRRANRRGTVI
jgi:hypothetical protein